MAWLRLIERILGRYVALDGDSFMAMVEPLRKQLNKRARMAA